MRSNVPQPATGPSGGGVRFVFKVAVVLALAGVGFCAVKVLGKKPVEPAAALDAETSPPEPSPSEPAAGRPPPVPPPRPPAARPVNTRPATVRSADGVDPRLEQAASNLWAAAGTPTGSKNVIWRRLPALQAGVEGVLECFEPPVFYDVADAYAGELRSDFAQITSATNMLKQYDAEFRTLQAGLEADRQDYLRQARAADERRQNEYAAALKKQTDLQALYLECKRQFQQESAATKPQLQDVPDVFERKLAQYERVKKSYEDDINQFEAAIHAVTKQVAETGQALRGLSQNINRAFEESAQDALGRLSGLSNRLHQQIGGVNTLIRDYNAKLALHGTPLEPAR